VLLAFLPDAELRSRFEGDQLPAFNANTIREFSSLLQVLDLIRERGFAVDDQEYTPGLRCVAVPVFDIDGSIPAALSASIPLMRADEDQLAIALRSIAAASIDISSRLGRSEPDRRLTALTRWQGAVLAS